MDYSLHSSRIKEDEIYSSVDTGQTRLKTNSILDRKFKYTLEFIQGLGQVWARFGPGWRIHLTRSDQSDAINLLIAACQEFCSTIKEYENSYKHISTEIKLLQKENLTRLLILQENLVYFGTSDITKISRYSTCMKNLLYFWTFNMSNI